MNGLFLFDGSIPENDPVRMLLDNVTSLDHFRSFVLVERTKSIRFPYAFSVDTPNISYPDLLRLDDNTFQTAIAQIQLPISVWRVCVTDRRTRGQFDDIISDNFYKLTKKALPRTLSLLLQCGPHTRQIQANPSVIALFLNKEFYTVEEDEESLGLVFTYADNRGHTKISSRELVVEVTEMTAIDPTYLLDIAHIILDILHCVHPRQLEECFQQFLHVLEYHDKVNPVCIMPFISIPDWLQEEIEFVYLRCTPLSAQYIDEVNNEIAALVMD